MKYESFIPMNNQGDYRLSRLFCWILSIGALLIFFWGIGSIPLLSTNEGRRLVVLQEMLTKHNWLIPYMNGEVYLEKPPLFNWIGGIIALLSNSTAEWVMRLTSGLSALGIIGLLFFYLRKSIGHWAALYSVLVLVTSYAFTHHARVAEIEMLLAFCIFASVLFFYNYLEKVQRRSLYASYAFLGMAFMTKGPVALLFFLPPLFLYWCFAREKNVLTGLFDWRGWLLFAVIAFPWFLYIFIQFPVGPLWGIFNTELSGAVAATKGTEPLYYYIVYITGALFPWIMILFWKPHILLKHLYKIRPACYFGIAALIPLLIFSLFFFKRSKYILPMYPAMAVWLGIALDYWINHYRQRWLRLPNIIIAIGTLLIALLVVYYSVIESKVQSVSFEAVKPLAASLDSFRSDSPVYFLQKESIQLVYYYGHPIPVVKRGMVNQMLGDDKSFLLLVMGSQPPDLIEGLNLCLLQKISPYETRNKNLYVYGSGNLCRLKSQ